MKSPFKFLDSYTKEDKAIFFGRDEETEYLYQRVFEQKVLLLYGVSGTGKSSLVYCGLANKFSDSDWLPVSIRRGADINQSMQSAIAKNSLQSNTSESSLVKQLRSLYLDHFKPIHFIFDQFEELFIFGTRDERAEFIKSIKKLAESEIPCRMLFVIREEYLAGITEFEPVFPDIFRNRLRIEKMTRQAAEQVISGPCNVAGINISEGFPKLLLEKLAPDRPDVELTYLQVYLDKLYREYLPGKDKIWDESLLDRMGNVSDLLGQFLDEQIRSLETPEDGLGLLKAFVSVQGTKRQLTIQEAVTYSRMLGKDISSEKTEQLIHHFVDLRIMRDRDDQNRYELRHDALAKCIYEKVTLVEKELLEVRQFIDQAYVRYSNRKVLLSAADLKYIAPYEDNLFLNENETRFLHESRLALTRARRRRRRVYITISGSIMLILLLFTLWALNERKRTEEQRRITEIEKNRAQALSYNLIAKDLSNSDPTKAIRIAEKALQMDTANEDIRKNLINIYYHNNFYKTIFEINEKVTCFAQHPINKDLYLGLKNGDIRIVNATDYSVRDLKGHDNYVTSIVFSDNGKQVLSASLDCTAILWVGDTVFSIYHNRDYNYSNEGERKFAVFLEDKVIANLADNELFVFNINGSLDRIINAHDDRITVLKAFQDKIVTASADKTIKLWNSDLTLMKALRIDDKMITCTSLKNDNLYFGGLSTGYMVDKGFNIVFKDTYDEPVYCSATSLDGQRVYLGYGSNRIMCRNILNWDKIDWFKGHTDRVVDLFVSPYDSCLYSVALNGSIKRWKQDIYIERVIDCFIENTKEENICEIVSDSRVTFSEINSITKIELSPDSSSILISTMAGELKLFDLQGNLIRNFTGFTHGICDIAFSNDGKKIVAG
ncbi:MAG: AAA family ATPase, partial [Bacteroidales bacterium]|nr:AAA family ATPase [Bacteroidales bacterium]